MNRSASAVHDTVIEGEREHARGADGQHVAAIHGDDGRLLLDRPHAQDRGLGLVDDRRADDRAEDAGVGDRERALLHFVGTQLLGARPLAEIVDGPRQAEERQLVGVLDHRDDEPPVERHRDAEVDVPPEDRALAASRPS